ncbi:MAG: hypothetical protein ACLGGX_12270 [Bdellovibrionia bacterium]
MQLIYWRKTIPTVMLAVAASFLSVSFQNCGEAEQFNVSRSLEAREGTCGDDYNCTNEIESGVSPNELISPNYSHDSLNHDVNNSGTSVALPTPVEQVVFPADVNSFADRSVASTTPTTIQKERCTALPFICQAYAQELARFPEKSGAAYWTAEYYTCLSQKESIDRCKTKVIYNIQVTAREEREGRVVLGDGKEALWDSFTGIKQSVEFCTTSVYDCSQFSREELNIAYDAYVLYCAETRKCR